VIYGSGSLPRRAILSPREDSPGATNESGVEREPGAASRRFRTLPRLPAPCFGVQGSGFRVQGSWFKAQGSGFRVQGSGFRVQGSGFRVQGFRVRVSGLGFRVWGLGFRVSGLGVGVMD